MKNNEFIEIMKNFYGSIDYDISKDCKLSDEEYIETCPDGTCNHLRSNEDYSIEDYADI